MYMCDREGVRMLRNLTVSGKCTAGGADLLHRLYRRLIVPCPAPLVPPPPPAPPRQLSPYLPPRRRRWFSLQQKAAVSRRTDEGSAVTVVPRLLWISRRTWASFRFSCRPPSHSTMYLSRPVVASCFQWVTFPSTIAVSASSP